MTKDNINNLLLTRVAVAVIGEEMGWWDTKFFNESSKAFLNFQINVLLLSLRSLHNASYSNLRVGV